MQHVPENPEEEFNFYMKFAKSLVLNLPDPIEKSRAASWLKKLKSVTDPESASLKNDYLKLLLFVLQRKRLVGPFEQMPDYEAPLEPFPDKQGLLEVARRLIALEAKIEEVACGEPNPYMVAVSSDLKEYAVAQEFNKNGAHCYYAVSGEAITGWRNAHKGQFPRGARSHEESIFDTSAPTKSKCALQYEQLDHTCAEKCAEASAQASQRRGAEGKSQKTAADSYRWLDRRNEQTEKTAIDWDPLEGRVEIDKHLETMSRTLEELTNDTFMKRGSRAGGRTSAPTPQDAAVSFDRNVDDVFGDKFYGAVASVKKICSTEKTCSDGRQVISQAITQGHSVVSRDALDGGVTQIHKNMNIYDGRRQGRVQEGIDYRSSGQGAMRAERPSTQPCGQKASRLPRNVAAPRSSAQAYTNDSATDRRDRGSRRCPAKGQQKSRHEKSRHEHFEPNPNETIDISTTENDSNEHISYHRLAPGVEESIEITSLHQPRQRESRYGGESQYQGGQGQRKPCPALRKLDSPPQRAAQRSATGTDPCAVQQCPARRQDTRSSRGPR